MSKKPIHTHAMTIRLEESLNDALTEMCWEQRIPKSAFIRAAVKRSLGIQNEMPLRLRKEPTR